MGRHMRTVLYSSFISSKEALKDTKIKLLGCPLDETSSFRGGTRFAPDSIRKASWTLETFSPYFKLDLDEIYFTDIGNLDLPQGNLLFSLEIIENAIKEIISEKKRFVVLGGEHLITFPIVKALKDAYGHISVVHFDAHCDLRDQYEGQKLSHATVLKRIKEIGILRIFQIGIRSGTKEEFDESYIIDNPEELSQAIEKTEPIYLTFDMDVFDPSLVPGVTTPEPGGLFFSEIIPYLKVLSKLHIIGADVVELSPDYDTSFVSSICAAKMVREIIIVLSSNSFHNGGEI
ncbi:MAG: agmatinase [Syntrophorhabdaceae bacterium]|nr:agmatinase [Syntrophorhabdaceae bacterium]